MRTGVSYMGHHNPKYVRQDLAAIKELGCDDVLLAAQENDFVYMRGKVDFFPAAAKEFGIRPVIVFWGALNYFGGGKSSNFLLRFPEAHQRLKDGTILPAACYNNSLCIDHIENMLDYSVRAGFEAYFIDEPSLMDCYCAACVKRYESLYGGSLPEAPPEKQQEFRRQCVVLYVKEISQYIRHNYPRLENMCCVMPRDKSLWPDIAAIETLDNLGTDIYWVNEDTPAEEMIPLVREMASACKANGKRHHEWLQCWGARQGREHRIRGQGEILLAQKPDALYVWAYEGQLGTSESCEDPQAAWREACAILKKAKML